MVIKVHNQLFNVDALTTLNDITSAMTPANLIRQQLVQCNPYLVVSCHRRGVLTPRTGSDTTSSSSVSLTKHDRDGRQ